MKKLLALLILAAVACFTLVGCANSSSDGKGGVEDNAQEQPVEDGSDDESEITEMFVTVNGNKLKITLEKNFSATALTELLKQGDIVYTADDYGDFEKVGNIGHTLPRNDEQIDTQAGDVILYQGCNICLYYGENSWNFTRIGRIEGYTASEIRSLIGAGNGSVQVTLSLD